MPRFVYKAKKGPTEFIDGAIDAENLDSAIDKIIQLGYAPVDVSVDQGKQAKEKKTHGEKRQNVFRFPSAYPNASQVAVFTRQLSDLIGAGVPLLQAMTIVVHQTGNLALKEILEKMRTFVEDGGTLSEALAQYPEIFPGVYISMVKSGEMSGTLDTVLERMSQFADKDEEMRAKVRASLAYPALILLVGALTIFILVTFVIPRLTTMLADLTDELPLPTLILIAISNFFARFWWLMAIAAGFAFFYFKKSAVSAEGKLRIDTVKLKLPLLGNFIKDVEMGRLTRTLATLLDGGVTIVSALEAIEGVVENEALKREVATLAQEVAGGSALHHALKKSTHFPETTVNIIAVGEQTGRLEQALYKLADSYEKQSDRTMKVITSLLEPVMIVVIGSIVGFIVMAMLLPIFKMNLIVR